MVPGSLGTDKLQRELNGDSGTTWHDIEMIGTDLVMIGLITARTALFSQTLGTSQRPLVVKNPQWET